MPLGMECYFYLTVRKRITLLGSQNKHSRRRERIFNGILKLDNKIEFDLPDLGTIKPKIRSVDIDSEEISELNFDEEKDLISRLPNISIIKISIENSDFYDEETQQEIIWSLEYRIGQLFIAIDLAEPGLFSYDINYQIIDNKLYEGPYQVYGKKDLDLYLHGANEEFGWPKIKKISILKSWNWLKKHQKALDSVSKTKVESAIHCFTNLYDSKSFIEDLFWSVSGLEALYASGQTGIAEQLSEKIQVVLGHPSDFQKIIKKLYNFRSRFIHGDIPIPSILSANTLDAEEALEKDLFKYTPLSTAILIASLQYLIINNKHNLKFRMEV